MTQFLDVRLARVGGELATSVAVCQGTDISNYAGAQLTDLQDYIRGQHVLIATHGFNVDRQAGIACLSNWGSLLQPPPSSAFVGLLWPGDSIWAHGLDYPEEPAVADGAGQLLGPFLDQNFGAAASITLASHSLGARVILSTAANMNTPVRQLILMAGAIDDNCFNTEFQAVARNVQKISVLASTKDTVLSELFPIGNFFGGLITAGHPCFHSALGRSGPAAPAPPNFIAPFQIPDNWDFNHGSYLQINQPPAPPLTVPVDIPANGSQILLPDRNPDGTGIAGWQEAFSSAFASTRIR